MHLTRTVVNNRILVSCCKQFKIVLERANFGFNKTKISSCLTCLDLQPKLPEGIVARVRL